MTIREGRMRMMMNLGEFARACGTSVVTMSSIERGLFVPPESLIKAMADVLAWPVEVVRHNIPDPEEIKRANAKLEKLNRAISMAKGDAKANGYGRRSAGSNSIPCPACGIGELQYFVSARNGHMRASCSIEDCVARWME